MPFGNAYLSSAVCARALRLAGARVGQVGADSMSERPRARRVAGGSLLPLARGSGAKASDGNLLEREAVHL